MTGAPASVPNKSKVTEQDPSNGNRSATSGGVGLPWEAH